MVGNCKQLQARLYKVYTIGKNNVKQFRKSLTLFIMKFSDYMSNHFIIQKLINITEIMDATWSTGVYAN